MGLAVAASNAKFDAKWIEECAKDLVASRERSLVLVGAQQPVAVQLLALAINSALGNLGKHGIHPRHDATLFGQRSEGNGLDVVDIAAQAWDCCRLI